MDLFALVRGRAGDRLRAGRCRTWYGSTSTAPPEPLMAARGWGTTPGSSDAAARGARPVEQRGHQLLPARRRDVAARRPRPGHGAVQLERRLPDRDRGDSPYSIFLNQASFALDRAAACVRSRAASRSAFYKRFAWPVLLASRSGCRCSSSACSGRPPTATRTGSCSAWAVGPALGVRQARARVWLGAVLAASGRCCTDWRHVLVPVVPVAAGHRRARAHRPRPGHRAGPADPHRRCAVRRGCAAADVRRRRRGARRRGRGSARADPGTSRMARITAFFSSDCDAQGACYQLDARALRAGDRAADRARPRGEPGEVAVPARGAQRLHLRDHRRGARAARHAPRPRPVRAPGVRAHPARPPPPRTSSCRSRQAAIGAWIARARPSSTSAWSSACSRSSACRSRWSPPEARRWSRRCSRSASCSPSPGTSRAPPRRSRPAPASCAARSPCCGPSQRGCRTDDSDGRVVCSPAAARPGTCPRCSRWRTPAPTRPGTRITALGTARGSRPTWSRAAATALVTVPQVPLPRRPTLDLAPAARPAAAAVRAAEVRDRREPAPRSSSASAATSSTPGLPRRPAARGADRRPRAERPARPGQPARAPGWRASVAVDLPGHRAAAAPLSPGCRCGRRSRRWPPRGRDPAGHGRRCGQPSGWTPTATLLV